METLTQITQDIYQVTLPLPFALNHVHCYLLRDDAGWSVLDTGLNTSKTRAAWQTVFETLQITPAGIRQIIVTHAHPDHYGMAGWFQAWCGAPVWMSPREIELANQVWIQDNLFAAMVDMFGVAGVPDNTKMEASLETKKMRKLTLPHPDTINLLVPGTELQMAGRTFEALHAPGHSDGQLIFYDAAGQLLLSGDQVLMEITPNIGLWPMSEPDPLGRYLASLRELAALEVRLALPGHGATISNWAGRLAELQQHHAERLEQTLAAVDTKGATPFQVSRQVFKDRTLTSHEVRFAVAETLAHLEYLVAQDQLRRNVNGVWLYWQP